MAVKEKKYTVADIYKEASALLTEEMQGIKKRPLSDVEKTKMDKLAQLLSQTVLKEMKIL
ncbi:hypothetical protein A2291_00860 [candidate division WOR-1 bacterium RIFOXYB2_FULL_42_35]|uniref:Uncharacterized protein n=1 Tax=candidate division WOR-1 bacterium RIFOXYC2_FULL_41_25 TaxID=1802586 RepID=A0A1F4TM37_UNCSA|nr:MAG: hypothetical protein A2247_05845 [candidate division WOR-1 bacterium RIFOXYA2_FULL_41_14]OGC23606.1 MAG: hypothetical protein A2291_00860 [candidate division WOR-1 bacterium RIFOXYB2_FULL_42_35]OGC33570.1 MAG: hypothetical protein A2462_02675 [candidate division WOR-1 bacterium RIFOXYC2_FULL_41_25]OGC41887.1 MAG: hypothetical protein A2548_05605 [candidate division WOR-1 bacterium RIFOXYD2_FULL_41_8]